LGGATVGKTIFTYVYIEKIFSRTSKTPTYFCDYLPFENDLTLDLYNFEFPLPKDDLYQVLLKLACCFWRRRF
jgi:hypothetical protein